MRGDHPDHQKAEQPGGQCAAAFQASESGDRTETEAFQLGEQIRQCAIGYMEQWEAKRIQVDMDVADVTVCTDRDLLELVWNNLLSNAVKFTGEGGTISVRSGVSGQWVWVEIRDTGCGIPEEALPGSLINSIRETLPTRQKETALDWRW